MMLPLTVTLLSVQVCPAGTNTSPTVWLEIVVVQGPLPVAVCAGAGDAGGDELADELGLLHAATATPSAAAARTAASMARRRMT